MKSDPFKENNGDWRRDVDPECGEEDDHYEDDIQSLQMKMARIKKKIKAAYHDIRNAHECDEDDDDDEVYYDHKYGIQSLQMEMGRIKKKIKEHRSAAYRDLGNEHQYEDEEKYWYKVKPIGRKFAYYDGKRRREIAGS